MRPRERLERLHEAKRHERVAAGTCCEHGAAHLVLILRDIQVPSAVPEARCCANVRDASDLANEQSRSVHRPNA